MPNEKFIIEGGRPLEGEVEVFGSKNAAGPILAASLLTSEECEIDNIPQISDVLNMIEVIKSIGAKVSFLGERKIKILAKDLDLQKMDFEKVSAMRMSVLLIGSLLSRLPFFKIPHPGGDRIGQRPISTHIEALEKLGVEVLRDNDFYKIRKKPSFGGVSDSKKEIILQEFSVTATENLMMAAVLSSGKIIIKGAACEPHVQDLGKMLKSMGAKIEGVGTHTIKIEGVKKLHGCSHKIIPDYVEAGTFIIAGALTPGKIRIKNANSNHLDLFLAKLKEIGVNFEKNENSIEVSFSPKLKAARIQSLPYPGFPTDLVPIAIPLLTQAQGRSLIHEPLYENRLNFVQELRKMGADIEIVDPHRVFVFGPTPLSGLRINSWDIRAGACLVIAGLIAKGKSKIESVFQIDRGYEKIEERLQKLGANIKRIST